MTRRNSEILADLDKAASHILELPVIAFASREALEILRDEVSDAIGRPAVEERTIDDTAAFLVTSLLHLARSRDNQDRWLDAADYFRECVREDYKRALEAELKEMMGQSA